MRRLSIPFALVLLCLIGVAGTQAAILAGASAKHAKRPAKKAKLHGLRAPTLQTPSNGAHVQQVPTLTWSAASGAAEYEYQLSGNASFHSIVLGSGPGKGTNTTRNLAAALDRPLPDGPYYWRVRGLTAGKEPGPWSSTRTLVKSWSTAPQLLSPASGSQVSWPTAPLVLSWSSVPSATEYIVTVAEDEGLSSLVLGSAGFPQKTTGTVFALPGTLQAGKRYFWAITPVDAEGHRGARSQTRTFTWQWPYEPAGRQVDDLNPDPRVFDPLFEWAPVPGAAKYEVEVNSAESFPVGSKWCCTNTTIGTSLSPTETLANNEYYWRVRALDPSGNAGEWYEGPRFTKAFDGVAPTVPNLTMSDVNGSPLPPGVETDTPIITWSPVAGAASYQVDVTRYIPGPGGGCNWAAQFSPEGQIVDTAGLAWTPLGRVTAHIGPFPEWPTPDSRTELSSGFWYCARVLARSDKDGKASQVVSNWTQVGGLNQPAFKFLPQPPAGTPRPGVLETQNGDYLPVRTGSTPAQEESCPVAACRSTPVFTWHRVPGATSYYVVIARDSQFTHVIDVASTTIPAYAPELAGEMPLDDETTTYYWAVVPASEGQVFALPPEQDAPHEFNKSSEPPTPLSPINGAVVSNQPTFRWAPARTSSGTLIWDGALNYTLQVSRDPTFAKPLDNIRTDSTAYTTSTTYPADEPLYWRVRANDANGKTEGLHWSPTQEFRRTLPVPSPAPGNPSSGQGLPVLRWTPATGATAYEVQVEQSNGSTKDFTVDSTAFTPTELYAPGRWHWQVRALFPTNSFGTVSGSYFEHLTFSHELAPPTGAMGTKAGSRVIISWNPDPYAKEYEVDVATSDSFNFNSELESRRVEGSTWAPNIDFTRPANKGTLFWRVAAVDSQDELSPFAEGRFVPPRPAKHCKVVKVKIKRGHKTIMVKRCVVPKKKHG